MFIFIDKLKNRVELYGCAKIMFDTEKELIKISVGYYYNLGTSDYETDLCKICKRDVKRSKHGQDIKTVPTIKDAPKQTNLNIPLDSFIKKGNVYYINMSGEILEVSASKDVFTHKGKTYKVPTKLFGNINDLK